MRREKRNRKHNKKVQQPTWHLIYRLHSSALTPITSDILSYILLFQVSLYNFPQVIFNQPLPLVIDTRLFFSLVHLEPDIRSKQIMSMDVH